MKRLWLAVLYVMLSGCDAQDAQERATDAAVLYVDVRTAEEFAAGHLRGALNIPHDQMAERWQELASYRDRRIVLYCRTGRRSGIALEVLKPFGFTRAENGGTYDALARSGAPVDRINL